MFQGSNNPHEEGSSQRYVGKGWVSPDCGFENSSLLPTTAQGNIILSSSGEAQRTQAKAFSSQEKLSTKPNNLANSSIQQNSNTETSDQMQYVEPFSLFQDLKRESASRRGKLLGLFIGTKYITTSISVKNQFEAVSHLSYHHKDSSMDSLAQVLQDLILKHEIRGIIIGNSACDVLDAIIAGRELDNEERKNCSGII